MLSSGVKIVIGVVLLLAIFYYIDFDASLGIVQGVQFKYLLFCGILLNFDRFFMAYKWSILLEYRCRFLVILFPLAKSYYYSRLLSPFVPSTVGEDVVRYVSLRKNKIGKDKLISSVVLERLLGTISHLCLVVFTLPLLSLEYGGINPFYLYVTLFFICLISIVTFYPFLFNFQDGKSINLPDWKIVNFLGSFSLAYRKYRTKKKEIVIFVILSIIENSFAVLGSYWFFLSTATTVNLYDMLLVVPAVMLFSKIPLSIGGLGIQEGCYVFFFSIIGISAEQAVAVSILGRVVDLVALIPGCLMFYLNDIFKGHFFHRAGGE